MNSLTKTRFRRRRGSVAALTTLGTVAASALVFAAPENAAVTWSSEGTTAVITGTSKKGVEWPVDATHESRRSLRPLFQR